MINCPKCDALIDVEEEDLDEGEPLICEECGVHLIVVGTDPLELEVDSESEGYDEDDDDFEEDEEDELDEDEDEEDEEDEDEEEDWR
jgi:alpha-aminoadipate carrier protein LysW